MSGFDTQEQASELARPPEDAEERAAGDAAYHKETSYDKPRLLPEDEEHEGDLWCD